MSETGEYDSVRVSADGVRVRKRYAADEFPVPAIALDISSGRNEPVTVRLSDRVPEGVDVDDLGFHPDFGSEHWTIEESRITFERELEPNATYTTVYGIRAVDDVSQFLAEPTIESVDPPLPETDDEEVVLESDDALVEDAISTDIGPEKPEETAETAEQEPPETLDLGGPSGSDGIDGSGGDTADETPETTGATGSESPEIGAEITSDASVAPPEGSLVAALASELRNNEVPQEDVEMLREVLAAESDASGSTRARLDQLRQDVSDLRAYTGALEAFLDEEGTGEELIDSFEARLDEFESDIESFERRIDHLETEFVVEVRGRIEELESEFETLESTVSEELERVDDIDQRADEISARADDADARTRELVDRLDEIESELDDIQSWKEQLIKTLGG